MRIAVASGKGGTGKTFLSTNLFATLTEADYDAALIDCDAEVPNASVFVKGGKMGEWETVLLCPEVKTDECVFCGTCAEVCHFHAITCIPGAHYIKVLPDLCHGCGACLIECPQRAIQKAWKTVGKVSAFGDGTRPTLFEARIQEGEHSPVPVIRDAIRRGEDSGAGYLILDAPPGCSCPFVNTVMGADFVILVTEPTPFGLSDLKHTVEVLRQLEKSFAVVINRAGLGDEQLKNWLNREDIPLWAEIPYDKRIAELYASGILAVKADEEMRETFTRLMQNILAHENRHH